MTNPSPPFLPLPATMTAPRLLSGQMLRILSAQAVPARSMRSKKRMPVAFSSSSTRLISSAVRIFNGNPP